MTAKSIASLLEDIRLLSEQRYLVSSAVRDLIQLRFKPVDEVIKYGGILFSSGGVQFCGLFVYKDHVSVEFGHGAAIKDPFGHLEGAGKLRRHLKLTDPADIEAKQLGQYLTLALAAASAAGRRP